MKKELELKIKKLAFLNVLNKEDMNLVAVAAVIVSHPENHSDDEIKTSNNYLNAIFKKYNV